MTRARLFQLTFACILFAIPIRIVFHSYTSEDHFLGLIRFGEQFEKNSLPEVKRISPNRESEHGYDGQCYAQIALRPSLSDPALSKAIDDVNYRGRRIGLPWLAFLLGVGQPYWVLQIFALLNLLFYALFLGILWRSIGFDDVKNCLLAVSLLWTSGTLICVSRALTDFPATAVSVIAMIATSR